MRFLILQTKYHMKNVISIELFQRKKFINVNRILISNLLNC
jgi:hypothetical protein